MTKLKSFIALCIITFTASCSAGTPTIGEACTDNNQFVITELAFAFDLKQVSSINILNLPTASVVMTFKDDWLPELNIITTNETLMSGSLNESGGYEKLGVKSISELFHKVKYDDSNNEYFLKVKKGLSATNPDLIHLFKKGGDEVIINENTFKDGEDGLYVIRQGDSRIMMLVADLNDKQTERLLEHVCL